MKYTVPAIALLAFLAPRPAQAAVSDDMGGLLFTFFDLGFSCAQIATIAENAFRYECSLEGPENASSGFQCINALDTKCVESDGDADDDGYNELFDCDDDDASVNPGADEVCDDGIDNNCDGAIDEDCGGGVAGVDSLGAGDLVITEIMQNPLAVADSDGEWFEVYNNSGMDLDLDGLEVYDAGTDSFTVSGETLLGAGEYAIFAKEDVESANGGLPFVTYKFSITLGNGDDELYLAYGGTVFDAVEYDGGVNWPDPNGASMSLDPDSMNATDNDDGGSWCEATSTYGDGDLGTPGAANDECAEYTYTSSDIEAIMDVECAGCHTSGGTSGGLNFDDFYNDTVNVPSSDIPSMDLIEPFDPDNSYIWLKLNNTHTAAGGAGSQMPLGSAPIDSADLEMIEIWIDEGAPE